MRTLRPAVMAMFVAAWPLTALTTPSFAQTCACAPAGGGYVIQADEAPPPLPEYEQPPIPAPGYYWTPGYWAWNNYDYYWVPGAWVEPPQPGLLWTPGYWAFVGSAYAFNPGYWGQRVGFYGGVDYGFGYGGDGYQGGRWDSGRFFYNTTVNNIGGAHITNVYRENIVNKTIIDNTSFNGGPGGVVAKPTAQELLAEKEPRVRATRAQTSQARLASTRSEQFVTANHGKPAIAATERPGQFKGKGVVPARAAGKAAEARPAETREKPAALERPLAPGAAPGAPRVEEKHGPAETLAKPEAAPGRESEGATAAGRSPSRTRRKPKRSGPRPRNWPGPRPRRSRRKQKRSGPRPRNWPGPRPRRSRRKPKRGDRAAEKPARPEPANAAQRAPEHAPARAERRPAQPERRPEGKECGRPGLPPCPK